MNQDRAARKYAVPVRGSIWGMNYNDRTERDIGAMNSIPVAYSDYNDFFPGINLDNVTEPLLPQIGARRQCPLRILQPHFGDTIECYVDIDIDVTDVDYDLELKLAVGRFEAGTYERVMDYTDEEIGSSWRRIRGDDTPLSVSGGKLSADLIDMLPALPQYGDPGYQDDAFVLILAFNKVPTLNAPFKFNYLNIHSSVTGAV